jgi:molecular chaperone DnaJ
VKEEKHTFFGSFAQVKACSNCRGKGEIPKKVCANCKGAGRVPGARTAEVEILPGIHDGQIIQLKGFGEAGENGTATGDLYVRIKVKPHPVFTRNGDDLIVKHELKVSELLFGKTIEVPVISGGKTAFEIPAHYDLKQPMHIKGKGMPRFGSFGHGDLLVDFILKAPKKLAAKDKKTLEDLGLE